jgi:hypothetical protein
VALAGKDDVMNEWTVRIEGIAQTTSDTAADALLEALTAYNPAVSYGHGCIAVTLTVTALSPREAPALALDAFAGAAHMVSVSHVEADRAA